MKDHPLGPRYPITLTMSEHEWHIILRELVYSVSTQERTWHQLVATADPRRDAWVVAQAGRLEHSTKATDRVLELLQELKERVVPST